VKRAPARARGADRITIKDAAAILGVSEMTLRRWDKSGKFKARRHPINNYRFYRRAEVVKLLKLIETGATSHARTAMA
jgi:site-specific DNA-methyltransferase (adenine-specific)